MTDKKIDWDELQKLSELMKESADQYENECNTFWNNLSYDDQLKAFYSVVKRIHKGELEDRGSYRWILYDVFGFGPDSYLVGMECGFLELHNSIYDKEYSKRKARAKD
jgi:hypothetical protein